MGPNTRQVGFVGVSEREKKPQTNDCKVLGGAEPADFIFKLHIGDSRSEARGHSKQSNRKISEYGMPTSKKVLRKKKRGVEAPPPTITLPP